MEKIFGKRIESKISYFLIFFLPVISGGFIYYLLRPAKLDLFLYFRFTGFGKLLQNLRHNVLLFSEYLPDWFIYSLPNGLWAFSYSYIITLLWQGSKSYLKYFWFASIPALAYSFEFLQFCGIIPGTFCFQDLFFASLGISLGYLFAARLNFKLLT